MVQPAFSRPRQSASSSPTAPLDAFLDNQPQTFYEDIYRSEAVCLCILRLLSPVCRHIVLHVLWSHQPIRSAELKALVGADERLPPEQVRQRQLIIRTDELVRAARNRHIFAPPPSRPSKSPHWPLNDTFKRGLRNALTGLGSSNAFGVPVETDEQPTVDELVEFGEDTWESILKYMVSSGLSNTHAKTRPRQSVLQLLHASGLMVDPNDATGRNTNYDRLTITSKGFQFLLEDRQTQLWQILMFYLAGKQRTVERAADVLSLFFSLGCMQIGQAYSASQSFPHAQTSLSDLEQYGFIYKPASDGSNGVSDVFFPTHLATSLCSGDASASRSQSADDKRFLILETNYKIYAYTANELEIAILNLFVDIRIRYPNLVVGKLDRKHVKAAMDKGISAAQIIAYLASHAHPQMSNHPPPILHPSVTDQLHLWDRERNRLGTQESVMFEFFSKELFDEAESEARTIAGLQLAVPQQRLLFVDPAVREAMKDYIKDKQVQLRGM